MTRRTALVILAVFLASCVVGPLLDQIHVVSGALSYSHPWLFGQAWWVGPQFGLAFAGIAAATLFVQQRFGSDEPAPTRPVRAGQQFAWFVAAYLTTGLLWERPFLVVALLGIGLLVRVSYERPDAATVRVIVLLSLAGFTYEALLSSIPGTFAYAETGIGPAPIWLPLLYAHAAPLVRTFMKNATVGLRQPA